jgi:hypothetical protein
MASINLHVLGNVVKKLIKFCMLSHWHRCLQLFYKIMTQITVSKHWNSLYSSRKKHIGSWHFVDIHNTEQRFLGWLGGGGDFTIQFDK